MSLSGVRTAYARDAARYCIHCTTKSLVRTKANPHMYNLPSLTISSKSPFTLAFFYEIQMTFLESASKTLLHTYLSKTQPNTYPYGHPNTQCEACVSRDRETYAVQHSLFLSYVQQDKEHCS